MELLIDIGILVSFLFLHIIGQDWISVAITAILVIRTANVLGRNQVDIYNLVKKGNQK
jgi:hypothetical protein